MGSALKRREIKMIHDSNIDLWAALQCFLSSSFFYSPGVWRLETMPLKRRSLPTGMQGPFLGPLATKQRPQFATTRQHNVSQRETAQSQILPKNDSGAFPHPTLNGLYYLKLSYIETSFFFRRGLNHCFLFSQVYNFSLSSFRNFQDKASSCFTFLCWCLIVFNNGYK